MTEREIPAFSGFHSGGKTNEAGSTFAPPAVGEPVLPAVLPSVLPVVAMTRREMRAAGLYDLPSDAPTPAAHPVTESTLAMPIAEIEAELATPVAPLVVEQTPITAVVPFLPELVVPPRVQPPVVLPALVSPASVPVSVPVSTHPVPMAPAQTAREAEQLDVAAIFGLATSVPVSTAATSDASHAPAPTSRRGRRAAAAAGTPADTARGRAPREKRAKRERPVRQAPQAAEVRAASDRKSIRQRVTGFGVMVLVGGLFAVLALPAYADNNASSLTSAAAIRTQKLAVSETAADDSTKVSRDGYTATSASDLKTLYASAIRRQNISAYLQSGAKSQGDDYPWFGELSRNQGGGLSPLNYYYRECVDFVAWRLNRDAGSTQAPFKWVWSNLTPSGGNASQWKSAWLNHGWATGTTPKVGAVAWFPYNHVAYVSGILNDGSVALEEYNWQGQHLYTTRIIQPADAYYLYAPPA
jgi:surface antigen